MKAKFQIAALTMAVIALFNVSCASNHSDRPIISIGQEINFEKASKLPPFTATVESIDIDHSFIFGKTTVDVWLRKPDTKIRLVLHFYPANKFIVDFAHSLHKGQSYVFPQVFADYVISQQADITNKPSNN